MSHSPDWLGLAAAASGAVGTVLLYKGSFAFVQQAFYTSPEISERIRAGNRKRQWLQRLGLGLLLISFLLQGADILLAS